MDSNIQVRFDRTLADETTFRYGGPIAALARVGNADELCEAVEFAKRIDMTPFVKGGGSNLLGTRKGFSEFMINFSARPDQTHLVVEGQGNEKKATVPASFALSATAKLLAERGLDLTPFFGIPGTIGAAVRNNAGISESGVNISDFVESVAVIDIAREREFEVPAYDLRFAQRYSELKGKPEEVVTEVRLRLPFVQSAHETKARLKAVGADRRRKNLEGKQTAGSFFVNGNRSPLSARAAMKQAGLNGFQDASGVGITPTHCFLQIDPERNPFDSDVIRVIETIRDLVLERTGKRLSAEVEVLGPRGLISIEQFLRGEY